MADKLNSILDGEIKEEKGKKSSFTNLEIAKDAYEKVKMYADLSRLSRNSWSHLECYGFLLGSLDRRNRIVEDIYFAHNQRATHSHVEISGESVQKAGNEIAEMGKRIFGWWHSHSDFKTFHSKTDNENLVSVLNQIAPVNYIRVYEEFCFPLGNIRKAGNGKYKLVAKDDSERKLEILFDKDIEEDALKIISAREAIIRIPVKISYAYSLVVSAKDKESYAEVAVRKSCDLCKDYENYHAEKIPVKVLDYTTGLRLDKDKMKKEIESKLEFSFYPYFLAPGRRKLRVHGNINESDDYDRSYWGGYHEGFGYED